MTYTLQAPGLRRSPPADTRSGAIRIRCGEVGAAVAPSRTAVDIAVLAHGKLVALGRRHIEDLAAMLALLLGKGAA